MTGQLGHLEQTRFGGGVGSGWTRENPHSLWLLQYGGSSNNSHPGRPPRSSPRGDLGGRGCRGSASASSPSLENGGPRRTLSATGTPYHPGRPTPGQHILWPAGARSNSGVQVRKPMCSLIDTTFFSASFIGNKNEDLVSIVFGLSPLNQPDLGKRAVRLQRPRAQQDWEWAGPDKVGACLQYRVVNTENDFLFWFKRNYPELPTWVCSLRSTSFRGFTWKNYFYGQKHEEEPAECALLQ